MAASLSFTSSTSHFILHHLSLLLRPPPPSTYFSLFKPLHTLSLSSSIRVTNTQTLFETQNDAVQTFAEDDKDSDFEVEKENLLKSSRRVLYSSENKTELKLLVKLSVKEKKELAAYAHSLGDKLKSQQVGKSGVTESVSIALIETLESNELLKIKIHGTCPGELDDVVKQLEESTGSVVVGRIGRAVILYRPSLTKLKAEEKKKEAQRIIAKKRLAWKPPSQNKGQVQRLSSRGHQGSRRS